MKEVAPELLEQLKAGMAVPTIADLLVQKIVRLALDKKKSNQWAVELVMDRIEGKAVKGQPMREDGRLIEERLGCTAEHHVFQVEGLCSACRKEEM